MLADGRGMPKNGAEAEAWFRRAAEKGIREALQRLETSGALQVPHK